MKNDQSPIGNYENCWFNDSKIVTGVRESKEDLNTIFELLREYYDYNNYSKHLVLQYTNNGIKDSHNLVLEYLSLWKIHDSINNKDDLAKEEKGGLFDKVQELYPRFSAVREGIVLEEYLITYSRG